MESQTYFKNNLETLTLIRNKISFISEDNIITLTLPTIEDSLNLDFNLFLTIINIKKSSIENPAVLGIKANTDSELSMGMLLKSSFKEIPQRYFLKYVENSEFKNNMIMVNGKRLTSREYQFIIESFLVGMKHIPLPDLEKEKAMKEELEKMSEFERKLYQRQLDTEKRVAKAKERKKQDSNLSLEDVMLALMYHFPQLAIEKLMSMNFYTLSWYFSYVGQLDAHEVHRIAAGNGLLKNYKYFL